MKRTYDDDDGETIVNMNVDGMPWYDRRGAAIRRQADAMADRDDDATSGASAPDSVSEPSKEEQRAYMFAAIKASLLVVAVFALVFGAFIAFCDFVLFK